MSAWTARDIEPDVNRVRYDARVSAPLDEGGSLTVCDTFVEFAPLLTEAKNLRDLSEDLLIHMSMGWETDVVAEQLKAAIGRTRT